MKDRIRNYLEQNKITLNDGIKINRLGQGTWCMGENPATLEGEIKALKTGVEYGMTLIDTAEMYGSGKAEELIREATKDIKLDDLFFVSKVYPYNAGRDNIFNSCENSLKRLGIESLDLYLLHWRGNIPLGETIACMEELIARGKIKRWGVSNFDVSDMEELLCLPSGDHCAVNQVLYHLGSRGIEYSLLPFLKEVQIPVMAYSPLAQAGSLQRKLLRERRLLEVANKHGVTVMQILLSFVMHNPDIIVIPKSGNQEHVKLNGEAVFIQLDEEDILKLSENFPAPVKKMYLDMC